jgi:ABC-type sugar transport system permease subunit
VISVLWRYLLDNNIGLVNYYLGVIGLPGRHRLDHLHPRRPGLPSSA